jgi:histone-lysine N-methyltransferase SETMAR
LVESKETESSESGNAKIAGENNFDCIFYAKDIIYREFVPEKQTVNGKFYKEATKGLITRVDRVKPEFQFSGSWHLLHDNAPAHSSGVFSEFLAKRGIPVLSHPPDSPDLAPTDFFHSLN